MIIIFNVQTLFSLLAGLAVALGSQTSMPHETLTVDSNAESEVQSFTQVTEETSDSEKIVPEVEMSSMFDSRVEEQINTAIEEEKARQEESGESNTTITSTQETTIEKEERDAEDATDASEEPKSTESENLAEPNEIKVDSNSNVDINKILKKIDVDLDF